MDKSSSATWKYQEEDEEEAGEREIMEAEIFAK